MEKILASLMKDDRFRLHRPGNKVSLFYFSFHLYNRRVGISVMSGSANSYRTALYHNYPIFKLLSPKSSCF